jgi:nicotinamide-nucleotide amidase
MNVELITIGDEILIGQIIDTNSAWMAKQLNLIGARIHRITSISDGLSDIQSALSLALDRADAILITGGLGPTKDDVTKKAIADFLDDELVFDEPTYKRIVRFFERLKRTTTEAHRLQCYMPSKATLLFNKMGTAPGMWFEYRGKVIVSMPGVPYEMKYLMENEVLPKLKAFLPTKPIAHRTILTAGEGESRIAAQIQDIEDTLPDFIKLAFLPNLGQVRLRLSGSHDNETLLNKTLDEQAQRIKDAIPKLVFGSGSQKLEAVVGQILLAQAKTLATAESCTGGYLAHLITAIPGASSYFKGSIIAYDNEVKQRQLNVQAKTLEDHGAVSEETVKEMVKGATELLNTDIAIAISGVAGPGGGTPNKPVGTIWMAVGDGQTIWTRKLHAGKDRITNIKYASSHALNFIRQFLLAEVLQANP